MWYVGVLTQEYRQRMYDLLELYRQPLRRHEPVVWVDEKSLQLHAQSRTAPPMQPGTPLRQDYEYVRHGTPNLFVAVEPKAGHRTVSVTAHRGKVDFVAFVQHPLGTVYRSARRIRLVPDNLNTHFRACFEEVLLFEQARQLLHRVQFHYTPKHASWLNMAEIEIGILTRQCREGRLPDPAALSMEVATWQQHRNSERRTIQWSFTRQDADRKLGRHYVSKLTC